MDATNCTCPHCGIEFVSFHKNRIYCSHECTYAEILKRSKDACLKRFVCVTCGKDLVSARKRNYCSTECNPKKNSLSIAPTRKQCPICGVEFVTHINKKIYCTRKCNTEAHRLRHPGCREDYALKKKESKPKFSSVAFNTCLTCGKRFVNRTGKKKKYCSDECLPSEIKRLAVADDLKTKHGDKCCVVCGNTVGYSFGRSKLYCSKECRHKSEVFKEGRRAHKALRRARSKGVSAESIDPYKVFDRDRWRCQLCGVKTPKNRRGSHFDNAPELDHIMPVSKGGSHTYTNTQCACRKCNQVKSDTPLGQMIMFG